MQAIHLIAGVKMLYFNVKTFHYGVDIFLFQNLEGIRAVNAKIIIVTGFEHLARILLCEAYKQVRSMCYISKHDTIFLHSVVFTISSSIDCTELIRLVPLESVDLICSYR